MNTVSAALQNAARALHGHSDSPRLDAELLLGKLLGLSRPGLIARGNEPCASDCEQSYARLIDARRQGVPVAYLTGRREFWSLNLRVTPAVLVPRPETEVLVEQALQRLPRDRAAAVLDLGTGSGAIALAIATERPAVEITAVDISAAALEVAMQNGRELGLSRIDWRLGDWFAALSGKRFHMIVANPPYVAAADPALQQLAAEPRIALCDGPTGLEALTTIAAGAPAHLHDRGWLIMEHGRDQAPSVAQLLLQHGFVSIGSHLDLSGFPRVTLGTTHSQNEETS
ncbi:MAG: peptide chain release factor N(5)-glutamine methyltransferase [Steroidobacteraceae bacterium]